MRWDLDSPVSFRADGHTVHDFDKRFEMEDAGLVSADKFRWVDLDEHQITFDDIISGKML